jgi:hypothetical protein
MSLIMLLNDYFAPHRWVNAAHVIVGAGFVELKLKGPALDERARIERIRVGCDGVRHRILVGPDNGCAPGHDNGRRTEREIFNRDFLGGLAWR